MNTIDTAVLPNEIDLLQHAARMETPVQQLILGNDPQETPPTESKQHSKEADELDFLCRKLSDVRVRHRPGVNEGELRLSDVVSLTVDSSFKTLSCNKNLISNNV